MAAEKDVNVKTQSDGLPDSQSGEIKASKRRPLKNKDCPANVD